MKIKTDVKRIFVEKRSGFDIEAQHLLYDLVHHLGISSLKKVRVVNIYDVEGLSEEEFCGAIDTVFSEPPVDEVFLEEIEIPETCKKFAAEYLPGQYDQRADSAAQCIQILTQKERPKVRTAKLIILEGHVSDAQFNKIKAYCINPIESHEALLSKPETLDIRVTKPEPVKIVKGFISKDKKELEAFLRDMRLAMSIEDLLFCQKYFKEEKRDPSITEIKVLDTYWSDHCRHTTFLTRIEDIKFDSGEYSELFNEVYKDYLNARKVLYVKSEKNITLMDLATIGMKELRKLGYLNDLDVSDEINACSIVVKNGSEDWLVMFKNETHNHPTEIEPFGGAATCLGGAIRDPLSGRSYVYQAMRVTGSGDPRTKIEDTIPGKLPQLKITTGAAAGYSSYGNQIGLATGYVTEIYDDDFVTKRMEIGAVIGAAPKDNVVRRTPELGDLVILLGGRTGRDGCGGATGSSMEHTEDSLESSGAEVQKGNPPTERKIQRLFRDKNVSRMIKRCNDFGAGGVSVAIGELADGLDINLDAVLKKYEGLDGTELAISESQERMAVVVAPGDMDAFIEAARLENLESTLVAVVTDKNRLCMKWQGQVIVDISRDFLNTNGAEQVTRVSVKNPETKENYFNIDRRKDDLVGVLQKLSVCSQKGLVERFDSTIGAGSVLMPFGGSFQMSPVEGMSAKLPVLQDDTGVATIMTHGYNPRIAKWSPFHGAAYAIIEAVTRVVAMGGDYKNIRLTLQEYFEKLAKDPYKWGKPFAALLGAYHVQKSLCIPAIGGKDSMSGTFMDMNVPPTLVAFALTATDVKNIVSTEFKKIGSSVVLIRCNRDKNELPDFEELKKNFSTIHELVKKIKILSAHSVRDGGIAEAVCKMSFGNFIGFKFSGYNGSIFEPLYGSIILEISKDEDLKNLFKDVNYSLLGSTTEKAEVVFNNGAVKLELLLSEWEKPLEDVFPSRAKHVRIDREIKKYLFLKKSSLKPKVRIAKPRVFIPVFPGTNCEYDTAKAFTKAGALADTFVVRNLTSSEIEESLNVMARKIDNSQIIMLPGGFSGGDEPDGSGKFFATAFRNPRIQDSVTRLLNERDGLILGICNGFQALIKLGLVPYGKIKKISKDDPTLTFNSIGRHISCLVRTKVVSKISPWFASVSLGEIHTIPVSHGEGRFVANDAVLESLIKNGQIVTQYVDADGNPTGDSRYNPNGSVAAVEGITSLDGRVLGKMGHSERIGNNVYKNVPGNKDQRIFESGVMYFA